MSKKPLIGVTGPDKGWFAAYFFTWLAVKRQGGKTVRISPSKPLTKKIDGLVIGGGADVAPELYGEEEKKIKEELKKKQRSFRKYLLKIILYPFILLLRKVFSSKQLVSDDKARDELEYGLLDKAMKENLPILGICRGAQLMNVFCGGSLYQDISGFYTESPAVRSILPKKLVELDPSSILREIIGKNELYVNALHNQAIKKVAVGFIVSAREKNYIIQAVEHSDREFLVGVQWHPEYLPQHASQRAIFRRLVETAARKKQE